MKQCKKIEMILSETLKCLNCLDERVAVVDNVKIWMLGLIGIA